MDMNVIAEVEHKDGTPFTVLKINDKYFVKNRDKFVQENLTAEDTIRYLMHILTNYFLEN